MGIPKTADVVWLKAPKRIEIQRSVVARPGPHEILCATIVSAISPGTELAAFQGLPPLREGAVYPRLLGYCNVARVEAVGSSVTLASPGDRILSFMSHRSAFLLPEADILYKLPPGADAERLALTYLFHLGYNVVLRGGVCLGSRVLVLGLGVLGCTTVAACSNAGAQTSVLSGHANSFRTAQRFGGIRAFSRAKPQDLAAYAKSQPFDLVVVTTSSWQDLDLALKCARPLGKVVLLGFPGRDGKMPSKNPLPPELFYGKQLQIEAVGFSPEYADARGFNRFNERTNLKFLAEEIIAGRLDARSLISGKISGQRIVQAYQALEKRKKGEKTFLLWWEK